MPEKIRYSRRDLKGPDEFITTFGRIVAWCKENRTRVLAGTIALAAVLALVLGTRAYFRWEEDKASRDLWPHLNRAREMLQSPSEADPAKLAALEQFLEAHVNHHPRAGAAVFARYYLGSIAFSRGNYDLAIRHFRAGIATGKDAGMIRYLLRHGVASALEAKGEFPAAIDAYREAGSVSGPEGKVQSLLGEARVLSLSGKKSDAASLYRSILKDHPDTPMRDLVEIRLAQTE